MVIKEDIYSGMSIKYFCDRCGKEMLKGKDAILTHKRTVHKISFWKYKDEYVNLEHDLCKECGDSLVNWFNHPEKDHKEDI